MFLYQITMRGLFLFLLFLAWGQTALHAATPKNSTDALLSSLVGNSKGASNGLILLANEEITRPLSDEEIAVLNKIVSYNGPEEAGNAARVLARCQRNSISQRLPVVVQRFVQEISKPVGKVEPQTYITSLSRRVIGFDYFLRAFSQFEAPPVIEALKAELKKSKQLEPRRWLQIALGYVGAGADRAALIHMAKNDPDNSLRICAIHAYVRTAKMEAVPFLRVMASNQTITGNTCTRPIYGFQAAAFEEIAWLKNRGLLASKSR